MRTTNRQPYVCQIPYIANQTSAEENPEENKDDVDLMRKGLSLLEPLQETCLYYVSFCKLSFVKIFLLYFNKCLEFLIKLFLASRVVDI